MLNERYKYDLDYAKGMKKIYDLNYMVTNEGTLGEGIQNFRDYFLNMYNYYFELSCNFKNEILEPSKKILEDQNTIGKKLYNEVKKLDKDLKESLNNLEKSKTKFMTAAKNAEVAKLDSELAKVSYLPQPDKDKFNTKSNNLLKDAKEAERQYIMNINNSNTIRVNYIEGSKNVLFNFQILEEEFIEFSKNILRKFFIFSNVAMKNILFDTEKAFEKVEFINTNLDITKFIEENQTHLNPPLQIEYIPYSIMLRSKPIEEHNYPHEVVLNVLESMYGLLEKTNDDNFDLQEEKKKIKISEISKLACQGENFTDDHHNILNDLLKEKKYRYNFLSHLNKFRTNGIFSISKKSFDIIGEILWFILGEVLNDKDYESARYCIILSQTYHFMEENGSKISLQDKIEKHEILKNTEFWENFIAYSIFEEIEKQNFNDSNIPETEEEKNNRIANIVFSQLLPITDNMLSFEMDKKIIIEIILAFSKQYNIKEDLNQYLIQMVEEKVFDQNKNNINKESIKDKEDEDQMNILDQEINSIQNQIENIYTHEELEDNNNKLSYDIVEIIEDK